MTRNYYFSIFLAPLFLFFGLHPIVFVDTRDSTIPSNFGAINMYSNINEFDIISRASKDIKKI